MAHLWIPTGDAGWAVFALDQAEVALGRDGRPATGLGQADAVDEMVLIRSGADPESERWVVCCTSAARLRINGCRLLLGLQVLRDRDELVVGGGHRLFFGSETRACVQSMPPLAESIRCARCQQELAPGTSVVRCPGCFRWYHQTEEYPCWTYSPQCQHCLRATPLEGGYNWTPYGL